MMEQFIPWVISGVATFITVATYIRNGNKDKGSELGLIKESLLKANMKLDQVCATTNETRSDIKSLNKDISDIDRRVTVLERDVKTLFNKEAE